MLAQKHSSLGYYNEQIVTSLDEAYRYLDNVFGDKPRYTRDGLNVSYYSDKIRKYVSLQFVLRQPED